MLKTLCCFLFSLSIYSSAKSQSTESLQQDLKCYNHIAYASFELLSTTREAGDYEVIAEWSQLVSSDKVVTKIFEMEGGFQYVILLTAESGIDASGIEIRDDMGDKVDYTYKINELENNQINFFFTPPANGIYQLNFRIINRKKPSTCMYMGILKGSPDPLEND